MSTRALPAALAVGLLVLGACSEDSPTPAATSPVPGGEEAASSAPLGAVEGSTADGAEGLLAVDVCAAVPVDVAARAAAGDVGQCRVIDPPGSDRGATFQFLPAADGADAPLRTSLTVRSLADGELLLQRVRDGAPAPEDVADLGDEALAVPAAGGRETLVARSGQQVLVVEHYAADPAGGTPGPDALAAVARAVLDAQP